MTMFFQRQSKTRFAIVPYRGGAARMQDLVAGRIDLSFGLPDYLPMVSAGNIKAYAVASDTRIALAPDVPTFQELGLPSVSFSDWFGIFVPKVTPLDIIGALNMAVVETLGDSRVRSRFADVGYEVFPREQQTPEALVEMQNADAEKWWPIIKELGIKPE
jgi:tripartite-type tricarboxylate transporter receptor subunit TctC